MAIPGSKSVTPERASRLRPLLRALHRDAGYLAVGLTIVYAVSGLAVNHLAEWDPNFKNYQREFKVAVPLPDGDEAAAARVLAAAGLTEKPRDVYRASATRLELTFDKRSLHVDTQTGRVVDEGQSPRFFLRVANWLHLNRGKKAWRYFADAYAAGLLFLAVSGLFMLPGRRGIRGRGAILAALGAAVPVVYLIFGGSP